MKNENKIEVSVLHIFNTAGVASTLAKWQKKIYNWKTWVITRARYDLFGLTTYGSALKLSAKAFKYYSIFKALRYELVHLHSADVFLPSFRRIYKGKVLVIHYHGSDIRGRWNEKRQYWKYSDVIIVSTPDLLTGAPSKVNYLPNPVDIDLFYPMPQLRKKGTALYVIKHQKGENIEWAKEIAEKLGLNLTIIDREKTPIPYHKLPKFLNQFEYYIDRNYIASLSKTALEALACGVKVIRWDNKIVDKLPKEHEPQYVIKKLCEIYSQALERKIHC